MIRPKLVILAKYPSAGRVKTRLDRDIGVVQALRFYRPQLARTCATLAHNAQWDLILSLAPDFGRRRVSYPVDNVVGQGQGDLGERMQRLFDAKARGPLIIIGADIPGITGEMIARAFHLLKGHDSVFGPSPDGGYWLVGQRRTPRSLKLFQNVRWSSLHTLQDTLNNLDGATAGFVDQLNDIDTGADLM